MRVIVDGTDGSDGSGEVGIDGALDGGAGMGRGLTVCAAGEDRYGEREREEGFQAGAECATHAIERSTV